MVLLHLHTGGIVMNKVILKGRLTRNPQIRYTSGEESICVARFTLAVDDRERSKDAEGNYPSNFIPCIALGRTAELIETNLCKGKEILLCGKMQSGSYTNKDNKKVYTLECFVREIEYCGKKADTPMPCDDSAFMNIPDFEEEFPFK